VVGGDLQVLRGDEEEDIVLLAYNLDVGFIACAYLVDGSFAPEIEAMAVEGSRGSVVEDRLVGDGDTEDGSKN